jgi:hypothetical protein
MPIYGASITHTVAYKLGREGIHRQLWGMGRNVAQKENDA